MGFFRRAGKKFEETKRSVVGGDEFVCTACEATFEEDYEYCPHCGEASVEALE